jgi:cysteinyl-tRNA synthetase
VIVVVRRRPLTACSAGAYLPPTSRVPVATSAAVHEQRRTCAAPAEDPEDRIRMAEFRLYNTLTRSVEPFAPADRRTVRMYTCGPTVYNPAHLGNFRTFLFEDLLRRALRLHGWGVEQVMNLTDVDDKIIKRANEQGKTIREVTEPVVEIFHRDREYLRIESAEHYPKATEYVPQMIELVTRLIERGVAYQAEDGSVYFAIDRFPEYGRLSRLDTREIKAGARVAQDDYTKENAQDFALWKAAKEEDERTGAAWDSPWGRGRPGWHLECSAMAMSILGETIDLHCGGVDLIFPHHEDEIAQSEAATGKPFSRFWCHGAFLNIGGAKMAKRVGNVQNVQGLRDAGIQGVAYRYVVFQTKYRQELNFVPDELEAAVTATERIGLFAERLREARCGTPELAQAAAEAEGQFREALADDLNAPQALAVLHDFMTAANRELDRSGTDAEAVARARAAFELMDGVLDLVPDKVELDSEFVAKVEERVAARNAARVRRDFAASDAIRKELEDAGVSIEDTPQGTRWRKLR